MDIDYYAIVSGLGFMVYGSNICIKGGKLCTMGYSFVH
ncbi:hypothetical protein [Plasmodium yoelii yoelii]|uniref:Uncharacterized protein n=1 Tax=Plasmodium yoelii yoelii TaxID=73239 RepID=Q7RII8_PLAYO|nr:hypothetical protein [Plasmodium yoelii yoelii]